jgi:hypothetical protein
MKHSVKLVVHSQPITYSADIFTACCRRDSIFRSVMDHFEIYANAEYRVDGITLQMKVLVPTPQGPVMNLFILPQWLFHHLSITVDPALNTTSPPHTSSSIWP